MQTLRFKSFIVFTLILFVNSIVSFAGQSISDNIYGRLTANECDSLIKANESNPNFVILDVRTPAEWNNYHILGSINRSTGLADFTNELDALPKHKIYLLHCQSGGRSAGAFQKMKDLDFAEVYEMIGGINSWNAAALPTTTITEPQLMLVNYESVSGDVNDTLKVTVTNRANGILSFTAVSFNDLHTFTNNFNLSIQVQGAFDYTFSVIHALHYSGTDSTQIVLESNGGELELNVVFINGVIQKIQEQPYLQPEIYPNPARENLFVKNINPTDKISVLNIQGQKVLLKEGFEINNGIHVAEFRNGIYILQISTGRKTVSRKFIVRH